MKELHLLRTILDILCLTIILQHQKLILVIFGAYSIDINAWKEVNDRSPAEGQVHWSIVDPQTFQPVIKPVEGLEEPKLAIPIPAVKIHLYLNRNTKEWCNRLQLQRKYIKRHNQY